MVNEKDFIEIDYTGTTKEGIIFDTTIESVAKTAGIQRKGQFKSVTICLGEGHILMGLEKNLIGKEVGKEYKIALSADDAFGPKDIKLIKLVPTNKFASHNIRPVPGLQVDFDGVVGVIKTVSGGRTLVDFNHPLAGKDVVYTVKILKKVDDKKEQVVSIFLNLLHMVPDITITGNKAVIKFEKTLPKELAAGFGKRITELTGLEVEFTEKSADKVPENTASIKSADSKESDAKKPSKKSLKN